MLTSSRSTSIAEQTYVAVILNIGVKEGRLGLQVRMCSIRLGNVAIDGEVLGKGWKMALELKTPRDDITRGIGQLAKLWPMITTKSHLLQLYVLRRG
jgi:hypothetical protein